MTRTLTAALAALAIAGAGFAIAPAQADSYSKTTTVTTTGPAFGYDDGYWSRDHVWHAWADHEAMEHFRHHYHQHFYAGVHARYPDEGWREHDEWWERDND